MVWPFARCRLKTEILEILRANPQPLSLEQIVMQLFHRRQQLSDLIVLSSGRLRRKQRLSRQIAVLLRNPIYGQDQERRYFLRH